MSAAEAIHDASTLAQLRPTRPAALRAFAAMLGRDLHVLRKTSGAFLLRVVMQPMLTVFVFTYVFPKIGQGIGGGDSTFFSTLLVPGTMATACIFQGIQSVALPLVQDFGYTREIEDRVLAPLPVWCVALEKVAAGAIQSLLAALIVLPLARFIPATPVHLDVQWVYALTILPLGCLLGASLGLVVGTRVAPTQVPLLFSVLILPMTFLGATYYPWAALAPIEWLKWAVLVNPLVYMSEGFRASLTPVVPHMAPVAVYVALVGMTAVLMAVGVRGFARRVLS